MLELPGSSKIGVVRVVVAVLFVLAILLVIVGGALNWFEAPNEVQGLTHIR
jgi:hypothetical protein